MSGRDYVLPEDVHAIAHEVLRHRVLLSYEAEAEGVRPDQVIDRLLVDCSEFASVDYRFLYDEKRHLFVIGYNVTDAQRDTGYYDLLASEVRLCVFAAIAHGQIPQEAWFALGRLLTAHEGPLASI